MYLEMGSSKFPQHELPNLIVRIMLGRVVTEILIKELLFWMICYLVWLF